jgi:glycosyltransferase involved in cell wall biosynthesis
VDLSIVIPTHKKVESLLRVLDSLASQTCKDFEVHVVQDCDERHALSERAVVEEAEGRGGYSVPAYLTWHCTGVVETAGAAAARNVGIIAATAPRILFIDDDCACPSDLVAAHAERGTGDALVGFRSHIKGWQSDRTKPWEHAFESDVRWRHMVHIEMAFQHNSPHLNSYVFTCHLSVPTYHAKGVGGFWEEMKGSGYEDREFALRIQRHGCRFALLRKPQVYHLDHPKSPLQNNNVKRNRDLFGVTVSDRSAVVRNRGVIS